MFQSLTRCFLGICVLSLSFSVGSVAGASPSCTNNAGAAEEMMRSALGLSLVGQTWIEDRPVIPGQARLAVHRQGGAIVFELISSRGVSWGQSVGWVCEHRGDLLVDLAMESIDTGSRHQTLLGRIAAAQDGRNDFWRFHIRAHSDSAVYIEDSTRNIRSTFSRISGR